MSKAPGERLAEEFRRPFETAAENIQNLFTDTFEGIFEGSIDSAADAADAMKRIFIRLAAEMARWRFSGLRCSRQAVSAGWPGVFSVAAPAPGRRWVAFWF